MRILVAGVGNIFLSDDGFGVEVARRMAGAPDLPDGVDVGDFGIRGIHLAYELSSYGTAILVDATPRGGAPGSLYALDLTELENGFGQSPRTVIDAHGMTPDAVLEMVGMVGGTAGRVLLVGCEPATVEPGMDLSEPVAAAVAPAIALVRELIEEELHADTADRPRRPGGPGHRGDAVPAGHPAVSEDAGDVREAGRHA